MALIHLNVEDYLEPEAFVRTGECKRCGVCCTKRGLDQAGAQSSNMMRPLREHDPNIGARCPHLYFNRKGLAVCADYKNRPDWCRKYPQFPVERRRGCGYEFEKRK
jgi:Fe-S-cluster containining protein